MPMGRVGVLFGILIACVVGCGPREEPLSDYQLGYNHGIAEVRHLRANGSTIENWSAKAEVALGMLPVHEDKSDDWNAGYRLGIKEEMAK